MVVLMAGIGVFVLHESLRWQEGLGIVLAGPITENLNYHWLFWIPGAVVALAA